MSAKPHVSAKPRIGSAFRLRRSNWRGARPLGVLIGSPAAFVLLLVALASGTANYLAGEADRVATARANGTIAGVERLLSAVKDLETGERGYVLVGNDDYLKPYTAALTGIDTELNALGSAAQEPTRAGGRSLAGLIAEKRDFAARVVAARRDLGFEAANAIVRTGDGKTQMDAIRAEAAGRQAATGQRLHELRARERWRSLGLFLLSGLSALGAIVLLARLALVRRQEGLRMSRLLDGVLANAPVGLGFLDRDLKIRHMNRALATMSERGFGADLGAPIWAILPTLRAELAPKLAAALHDGLVTPDVPVAVPTPSAPGGIRRFAMSFYPLRGDEADGVEGVGLVVVDETVRRLAEARTRRSEERFRSLIEASASIVWTAAADGGLHPRQTAWTRFTGQDDAAYAGLGFLDSIHPDDRAQTRAAWSQAVATLEPYVTEHRMRRAAGDYRHMSVRAVPILEADGALREWVGTHTDITERKEAEAAIEAAREAAEQANAAKSQFLANMSHELRTPLSAVIGYAEMVQEELEDLGQAELIGDMKKIESNARHLLGLINDVLDISKIEADRVEIFCEEFSVAEVVAEVAATVEGLIGKKGNTLTLSIAADAGQAHSDVTKLRQCLINLLSNAAKFTENGRVDLAVSRAPDDAGDRLRFTVSDTGIGMNPEQVGRLFERFTQADASTTRRFGGTGLGLSITKAFAEMLGGAITVASREGEGTVFTLTLPARSRGGEQDEPDRAKDGAPQDPQTILVVDDDAATRDLLARFLEREGFSVAVAEDGRRGLELARAIRPRAVLLDVTMPQMDGWAVLRALRADPDVGATPIVMVTVLDEQNLAFSLGATDYLQKPIDWGSLRAVVDRFRPAVGEGPILVVEDEADVRAQLCTSLRRAGFPVREAAHGGRALEAIAQERPCLVLLDLMMPEMDGFGFLRALRSDPARRDIPVVVLTAKDITADDRRRLAGQADRVLAKGTTGLSELARELRALVPGPAGGA